MARAGTSVARLFPYNESDCTAPRHAERRPPAESHTMSKYMLRDNFKRDEHEASYTLTFHVIPFLKILFCAKKIASQMSTLESIRHYSHRDDTSTVPVLALHAHVLLKTPEFLQESVKTPEFLQESLCKKNIRFLIDVTIAFAGFFGPGSE